MEINTTKLKTEDPYGIHFPYFIQYLPVQKELHDGCRFSVFGKLAIKLKDGDKEMPALTKKYGEKIKTKNDYLKMLGAKVVEPYLCSMNFNICDEVININPKSEYFNCMGQIDFILTTENILGFAKVRNLEKTFESVRMYRHEVVKIVAKISNNVHWLSDKEPLLLNQISIKDGICKVLCKNCKTFH